MIANRKLSISFILAVAVHCFAAVGLKTVAEYSIFQPLPSFVQGDSSVSLTFVPSISSKNEIKEQPKDQPQPAAEPEPVVHEQLMPDEFAVVEATENKLEKKPEEIMDNDADLKEKGVQMDTPSTVASNLRPRYPYSSKMRGEEGTVVIKAVINVDGWADEVKIVKSSGYRSLDRSAVTAFKQARFHSGNAEGNVEITQSVQYKLED